jgi:hypothetical protein
MRELTSENKKTVRSGAQSLATAIKRYLMPIAIKCAFPKHIGILNAALEELRWPRSSDYSAGSIMIDGVLLNGHIIGADEALARDDELAFGKVIGEVLKRIEDARFDPFILARVDVDGPGMSKKDVVMGLFDGVGFEITDNKEKECVGKFFLYYWIYVF